MADKTDKPVFEEQTISIEEMDMCGGEAYLEVASIITPTSYKVISVEAKKTEWGNRADFIVESKQGYRYVLSSWNFIGKKFKPMDIIGKDILLSPYTAKKLRLDF